MTGAPMIFVAPSGGTVRVGRNAAQNYALTRTARESDVWMHAEGPGAHVVLEPDPRDMRFAADLAVYWSKARGGKAMVTVARIRDVKTRKDGSATVSTFTTLIGRPLARAP